MSEKREHQVRPVVLTIAGFDPSGHAGIIADIRTITGLGCRPVAAISSLTSQTSRKVSQITNQSGASLRSQVAAILDESVVVAVKVGMLPTSELILEMVQMLDEFTLPSPVVDPVLRSTSGYDLMEEDAIEVMMGELISRARVITPNVPEAQRLTGLSIKDECGMREAATRLRGLGARAVLVKGGHLAQKRSDVRGQISEAVDILDDRGEVTIFRNPRFNGPNLRGTGCMMSSAIACGLAQGRSLSESVGIAKDYVTRAMRDSALAEADPHP